MRKNGVGHSENNAWLAEDAKYVQNVENHKRRQALPLPWLAGQAKFFSRLLNLRKAEEFIFITKTVAKNRG